jgi:hypothetical protein
MSSIQLGNGRQGCFFRAHGHESEPARPSLFRVLDHHRREHRADAGKKLPQFFIGKIIRQPAHKKLFAHGYLLFFQHSTCIAHFLGIFFVGKH